MTDLTLTVRGTARVELAPEQASVRFTVATDGPDRDAVLTAARDALALATAVLESHENAGGVLEWSVDRLSVTAQRPWANDGRQLPHVHRATASGCAILPARSAAGETVPAAELTTALSADPRITVDGVHWRLTDASMAAAWADARARAVADARAAAETLAAAEGRPRIRAVALADPGMLDTGPEPQPRFERAMAMSMDVGGAPEFVLNPQRIIVEAEIDARFVAE